MLDIVRSVTSAGSIEMDEELLAAIGLILRGFQALAETDPPIDLLSLPGLGAAPRPAADRLARLDPDDEA